MENQADLFKAINDAQAIPERVRTMFNQLAIEAIEKGFEHYSADAVLHRIRWHMQVERGHRDFKCNNNWTATLARQFMALYPQHDGFFKTRQRKIGA